MCGNIGCTSFPSLLLPDGQHLGKVDWRDKKNLAIFEKALDQFEDFWVVDVESEKRLEELWMMFRWGCISSDVMISILRYDEDSLPVLRKVGRMGLDFDFRNKHSHQTSSHICSAWASVGGAALLAFCRPDLSVKDEFDRTPVELARDVRRLKPEKKAEFRAVMQIWNDVEEKEFPSVAELAYEKNFWALQNLCRRRLVPVEEMYVEYEGKTALEWVEFYRQEDLAREVSYYFSAGYVYSDEVEPSDDESTSTDGGEYEYSSSSSSDEEEEEESDVEKPAHGSLSSRKRENGGEDEPLFEPEVKKQKEDNDPEESDDEEYENVELSVENDEQGY